MQILALERVTLSRRSILKTGLIGTTLLAGASTLAQLQGCQSTLSTTSTEASAWRVLRPKDRVIMGAIAPVALAKAFPEDRTAALDKFLPQIDTFLFSTSITNHAALHQLFDFLDMGITRVMLAGLWQPWEKLSDAQVEGFLESWRGSAINQLRLGYAQLTQVLSLVWYAQPENVPASLYPGAPQHIPTPLTQERTA